MITVLVTVCRLAPTVLLLAATCLPACAVTTGTSATSPTSVVTSAASAPSARAGEPVRDTGDTAAQPAGAPAARADIVVPALDEASLDAWTAHLSPTADELAWEAVDWLPSYAEGVAAAQAQRRPLLLWAMNGHPLGCT